MRARAPGTVRRSSDMLAPMISHVRPIFWLAAAMATFACRSQEEAVPPQPQPQPAFQPTGKAALPPPVLTQPKPTFDPARRCGQAGPTPTDLPPSLQPNPPTRCPISMHNQPSNAPSWLWLSTEGVRTHYIDGSGPEVRLLPGGAAPRLGIRRDTTNSASIEVRPDRLRPLYVEHQVVTPEQVLPGPGTTFAGGWQAQGDARLHVRVRVEAAAKRTPAAAVAASNPCGDPSAQRTTTPPDLTKAPTATGEFQVPLGRGFKLGALSLSFLSSEKVLGDGPPTRQDLLTLNGPVPSEPRELELTKGGRGLLRADNEVWLVDSAAAEAPVRVRRYAVACPILLASPTPPGHVWMSTLGYNSVIVGDPAAPTLTIQFVNSLGTPELQLKSANAQHTLRLEPKLVGAAYTAEEFTVEVVDVQTWSPTPELPVVNVQLKIAPAS